MKIVETKIEYYLTPTRDEFARAMEGIFALILPPLPSVGWVYIVKRGEGLYKIGMTVKNTPEGRMAQLQRGHAEVFELVHAFSTVHFEELESHLHSVFAADLAGIPGAPEVFRLSDGQISWLMSQSVEQLTGREELDLEHLEKLRVPIKAQLDQGNKKAARQKVFNGRVATHINPMIDNFSEDELVEMTQSAVSSMGLPPLSSQQIGSVKASFRAEAD